MAAINPLARELVLKIVFYGPGLGGKTTTLQHVHDTARPEHRGKMVSLATAVDRTLYFDFLPVRVPRTRGMSVRLQLFTVPGQVYYNSTRKLVLTGADGVVFVADSQGARHDANLESLENLQDNLREQKRALKDVPHVVQYNKRDLPDVLPISELERSLNLFNAPSVGTVATSGEGVFEVLGLITQKALEAFNQTLPAEAIATDLRDWLAEQHRESSASQKRPPVPPEAILGATGPETLHNRAVVPEATPSQPTEPARPAFSFAALWPEPERDLVSDVESAISAGLLARAVELLDGLSLRVLASVGSLLGSADAPRDPALVPLLLDVSGPRYLAFRALVRDTRAGVEPDERAVLEAYAFIIEMRMARERAFS